jgi:hypothetical protein
VVSLFGPASKCHFWRGREKRGKTGETVEEFDSFKKQHSYHDLFNNSILTGLTGLPDRTAGLIERAKES